MRFSCGLCDIFLSFFIPDIHGKMSLLHRLSKDKRIVDACKKIDYNNYEDLYQELFVVLCEQPEGKLEQIDKEGRLHFWIVRTLLNMRSANGTFYRKYHVIHEEGEGSNRLTEEAADEFDSEATYREVERVLGEYERQGRKDFGWYKVSLLKMYAEVGSFRKMAELTGINYVTICYDINQFRKELLSALHTNH